MLKQDSKEPLSLMKNARIISQVELLNLVLRKTIGIFKQARTYI